MTIWVIQQRRIGSVVWRVYQPYRVYVQEKTAYRRLREMQTWPPRYHEYRVVQYVPVIEAPVTELTT